jgi:Tfp pilus assembly protein PilX
MKSALPEVDMNTHIYRQSGAVLVMSLVLLTVLTLIGVASMSSSSLEMRAAGNAQQRNIAFEAAQSMLDIAASLNDPHNTNNYQTFIADPAVTGYEQTMTYTPADNDITASAITTYDSCGKAAGNSLEEGKGVSMNSFSVRVTGQPLTGSSTSIQVQGVRFPAAACSDS